MEVNIYDLLDIYEKEVSKNTKNKKGNGLELA